MNEIIYYVAFALFVGIALAWNSDIKPRILKPNFKLGLLIYTGCFLAAFTLFGILASVLPDDRTLRIVLGISLATTAVFFGHHFKKRKLRKIFLDTAWSLRLSPEEYAKSLCPHYVTEYIESHLNDKDLLAQYIKHQNKIGHIPEYCAWAFLVVYCDHKP